MSTSMILEDRVFAEVKRLCYAGLDAPTLHRRALACLGRVVPFDGYCAHDADPASGLGMRMYMEPPDKGKLRFFLEHVYFEDEVNDFNAMIRARQPVALLSDATGGHLERALRYRMAIAPRGYPMSPGPISLMPALSRPRSEKFFITAVAVLPAGMNTIRQSGFASLTRCMYAAQSGFCSGTRTLPSSLPPPSSNALANASSES